MHRNARLEAAAAAAGDAVCNDFTLRSTHQGRGVCIVRTAAGEDAILLFSCIVETASEDFTQCCSLFAWRW